MRLTSTAALLLAGMSTGIAHANPAPFTIGVDSAVPRSVQSSAPYTIHYTVTNQGSAPLILNAQSSSLVSGRNECGIATTTQAPILPGKAGSIDVRCDWRSFGEPHAYRETSLSVEVYPYGLQSLRVQAEVFDNAKSTTEKDTCAIRSPLHCENGPKRIRRLCFYGQDVRELGGSALHLDELCPEGYFDRHEVPGSGTFRRELDKILETSCDRIEAITILDHGAPGNQSLSFVSDMGRGIQWISRTSVDELFKHGRYECMLTEKPRLIFGGCSVGKGCEGRLFMAAAAESLAPTKAVEVTAADAFALSGGSRIFSRTGSINGRDIVLSKKGLEEHWKFRGLRPGSASALGEVCQDEIEETVTQMRADLNSIDPKRCFAGQNNGSRDRYQRFEKITAEALGMAKSAGSAHSSSDVAKVLISPQGDLPFGDLKQNAIGTKWLAEECAAKDKSEKAKVSR